MSHYVFYIMATKESQGKKSHFLDHKFISRKRSRRIAHPPVKRWIYSTRIRLTSFTVSMINGDRSIP